MDVETRIQKTKRWLYVIAGAGAMSIVLVLAAYLYQFNGELSPDGKDWADFGSYMGGVLGPILAFFALVALLLTIVLQQEELDMTRREVRDSRLAAERSAKAQEDTEEVQRSQYQAMRQAEQKADLLGIIQAIAAEIPQALQTQIGTGNKFSFRPKEPILEVPIYLWEYIGPGHDPERFRKLTTYLQQRVFVEEKDPIYEKYIPYLKVLAQQMRELGWFLQAYDELTPSPVVTNYYRRRFGDIAFQLLRLEVFDDEDARLFQQKPA